MSLRRIAVAVAVLCSLALAAPAGATVTATTVTSPASGTIVDWKSGDPPITVSGTAPGATNGDVVNVRCYPRDDGERIYFLGNATVTGEAWSVSHPEPSDAFPAFFGPCKLRAVPLTHSGNNFANFPGIDFIGRQRVVDPVSGDLGFAREGNRGFLDAFSATSCGVCDMSLWNPATREQSRFVFYGNAALYEHNFGRDAPYAAIDGRQAYGAYSARSIQDPDVPGAPALSVDFDVEPISGDATITETQSFVRCDTEIDYSQPVAGQCVDLDPLGVRLERTITTSRGSSRARIVDVWRSTDGAPHTLELNYDHAVAPHGPTAWRFPWAGGYQTFADGDTVPPPPSSPASIFVDTNVAQPNGFTWPQGAITFDQQPTGMTFDDPNYFTLDYERTVPAGGTVRFVQELNIGPTVADVTASANAAQAELTPPPAPPGGAAPQPQAATPTATGTLPGGQAPRDTARPRLSEVELTASAFRVADGNTALSAGGRPRGTTVSYELSEAARVAFAVQRRTTGRRVGNSCRKRTRRNRTRRRCTRYVTSATLTRRATAGENTLRFTGRIRRRALRPGRYRFAMVAADAAGNRSGVRRIAFRIVRR